VQNPLLGARGATRVYGPQKGLRATDFVKAEKCLQTLAAVVCSGGLRPPPSSQRHSQTAATIPGAGAAGGLGFGLITFLRARAEPGFELFARFAKLGARLRAADLVITGEGRIDDSTFMGKGVGEIARGCRKEKIQCIALAGELSASASTKRFFSEAHSLTELTSAAKAKSNPVAWLERLAERTGRRADVS